MAHEFLRFLLSALVYGESPVGKNGGGDLSHHWSYKGEAGPGNWSMLYPTCSGSRQSPVNLRDQNIIYQDLPPFQFNNFHGHGGSFTLTNNGHTASISVVGNITVEGGALDGQYKTAELHFHWGSSNNYGSEHSINGRKYPLELHIVNYATKYGNLSNAMKYRDGLAVLGTFYDVILENPYFRPIEEGLRVAQYAGNFTELRPVNLMGLLPRDTTRYYRYYGSLTTPPCFQSVMWTLFEDIQHVSPYQIALLRQLYESNHDSHGDGSHHGGHGLNNHHGPIKQHFPYPEYLMDNYRPIQPDFDRVINCNIPRYADPNFIKRSRQQASNSPPQYDFIAQKIQQVNADALLNKTLHKWLRSKGLSTNILAPEQVPVQANPVVLDHAMSAQTNHAPRRPDQLDLQVIGTHRIGPNGEQVSEIQVQVDSASGISQEQLQMLLEDPAIMEQISQIVNSQGTNNHIHEIVISPNPQGNQAPGTQQNFQNGHQFNNQRQGHVNTQQQTGAASHGSPQASSQTAPQGPTVGVVDQAGRSQIRTRETAQGQTEVHVLEFPATVPQYLIDELLRHPQWSFMYNETLVEINDYMSEMPPGTTNQPRQQQQQPHQPHQPHQQSHHHPQPQPETHVQAQHQQSQLQYQQPNQFHVLPVQSVQPGLIQGQGIQVAHLPGVQVDLKGVSVDRAAPVQSHTQNFGQGHGGGHSQNFNQQHGIGQANHRGQGQGQSQVNANVQNFNQQRGQVIQTQGHTQTFDQFNRGIASDPFTAVNGNIQVDPVQSFNIGQPNNMQTGQVDLGRGQVTSNQRFQGQRGQQKLQIVSAREMNFLPWN